MGLIRMFYCITTSRPKNNVDLRFMVQWMSYYLCNYWTKKKNGLISAAYPIGSPFYAFFDFLLFIGGIVESNFGKI